MKKYLSLAYSILVFVGAGCASQLPDERVLLPQASYTAQPIPPGGKAVMWCDERHRGNVESTTASSLWIYTESFSGMHHEPTIYHVCNNNEELFAIQMQQTSAENMYTWNFVVPGSSSAFAFTASSRDPQVSLMEEESTPRTVSVTIDGRVYFFETATKQFSTTNNTYIPKQFSRAVYISLVNILTVIARLQNASLAQT